jgi:hypothetical protein
MNDLIQRLKLRACTHDSWQEIPELRNVPGLYLQDTARLLREASDYIALLEAEREQEYNNAERWRNELKKVGSLLDSTLGPNTFTTVEEMVKALIDIR